MATQTLDKLLYEVQLNETKFLQEAKKVEQGINAIGDVAKKVFAQNIGRELAKSLNPETSKSQLKKISEELKTFSVDAKKTFEQTFSRIQAKRLFTPFVDEAQTFSGQLNAAIKGAFDIKTFAIGTAAGFGLAQIGTLLKSATNATVKFAADFEYNMAKVKSIAGDVDLGILVKDIQRISTTVPQDLNTLSRALFFTITSGIRNVADAVEVLEVGAKAAVAGGTDAENALDALTTIINSFQKEASEASYIADILFRTVDQGKVEFADLAAAIGDVANPAALLGVEFADLGAAIATITKFGINIQETTTALRRLFTAIQNPQGESRRLAQTLGLDLSVAGFEKAGGLQEYIKQVVLATKKNPELLDSIAGNERALRALNIIAGVGAEEFQKLSTIFRDTAFTANAADKAFRILTATATNQFKLFKDTVNITFKNIGDFLLEETIPSLVIFTRLLSQSRPIDNYIDQMIRLGASLETIQTAKKAREFISFRDRIVELNAETRKFVESNNELRRVLESQGVQIGVIGPLDSTFKEAKQFGQELVKNIQSIEGLKAAQAAMIKLTEETANRYSILAELRKAEGEDTSDIVKDFEEKQNRAQALLVVYQKILTNQIFQLEAKAKIGTATDEELTFLKENRKEIERINLLLDEEASKHVVSQQAAEQRAKTLKNLLDQIEALSAEEGFERQLVLIKQKALDIQDTFFEFPDVVAASQELAAKQIVELLEKTYAKFDFDLVESLEGRIKLIQIQADEDRKRFQGNAELVKALYEIEEKAISDLIDAATLKQAQAIEKLKQEVTKKLGLGDPNFAKNLKLPVGVRPEPIEPDPADIKSAGDKFQDAVREAFVDPFSAAIEYLKDFGIKFDQEFYDFVFRRVDKAFADLSANIINFAASFGKLGKDDFSVFGVINQGLGLINSLSGQIKAAFDNGPTPEEQIKMSQVLAEKEKEAAEATKQLTDALQEFVKASKELSLTELRGELEKVGDEISAITGGTGSIDRDGLVKIREIIKQVRELEEELRFVDDSRIEDQIRAQIDALLASVGISKSLTDLELERLSLLLDRQDEINKSIDDFGDKGKDFASLMKALKLEFDLFDIEDPKAQFDLFARKVKERFGIELPKTAEGIERFAQNIFRALSEKSGDELEAFLEDLNLTELGQDEFDAFLENLANFVDELNKEADKIDEVDPIGIGKTFVKEITLGQANTLIDEFKTMRVLETQQLELSIFAQSQRELMIGHLAAISANTRDMLLTIGNGSYQTQNIDTSRDIRIVQQGLGGF